VYAIFEASGKQFKASEGEELFLEKIEAEAGAEVTFDKVLLVSDEGSVVSGAPYVEGAKVIVDVIKEGKGKKISVFKFKAKKNYRNRQGHRQPYTKVLVKSIVK